jgi:hypothetical protein
MPSNEDIQLQYALLMTYRQNLSHLIQQKAKLGGGNTPTSIMNQIRDECTEIQKCKLILAKWGVNFEDLPYEDINYHFNNSTQVVSLNNTNRQNPFLFILLAILLTIALGFIIGEYINRPTMLFNKEFSVSSNRSWFDTKIFVSPGDNITIKYISGRWSNCFVYSCPYVDANGVINRDMNSTNNVMNKCNHASLISKIGSIIYCINDYGSFKAIEQGYIFLGINDQAQSDNDGNLIINVKVSRDQVKK